MARLNIPEHKVFIIGYVFKKYLFGFIHPNYLVFILRIKKTCINASKCARKEGGRVLDMKQFFCFRANYIHCIFIAA